MTVSLDELAGRLTASASGRVTRNASLRDRSSYRIGGSADLLVEPANRVEATKALRMIQGSGLPLLVIGDGSNLLFDDAGFRGVVLRVGSNMSAMTADAGKVIAEAGIWAPCFALKVGRLGLSGLVFSYVFLVGLVREVLDCLDLGWREFLISPVFESLPQ